MFPHAYLTVIILQLIVFARCSFTIGQPLHLTLYIRPRFDEEEVEAVGNLIEDGEVVPESGESDDESYM